MFNCFVQHTYIYIYIYIEILRFSKVEVAVSEKVINNLQTQNPLFLISLKYPRFVRLPSENQSQNKNRKVAFQSPPTRGNHVRYVVCLIVVYCLLYIVYCLLFVV